VALQFWQPDTRQPWLDALGLVIKDFQAQNPNVTVQFTTVDWNTLIQKLTAANAAGSVPDLFYWSDPVAVNGAATNGLLAPVTDVINKVGATNWPKSMLDLDSVSGQVYGFPIYTYPETLWYRKDLFDAAGLAAPATMADVLADAKKLNNPAKKFYGIALYNDQSDPQNIVEVCQSFGCSLFDPGGSGAVTINSPETVAALGFLKELWKYGSPDAISKAETDARLAFQAGGDAIMFTSVSFSDYFTQAGSKVTLGQAAATRIPNDAKKVPATSANFASITIPQGAKNADVAKAFLEFWAQPAEMVKFASNTVIGHIGVMSSISDPASPYWTSPRIAPIAPILNVGLEGASKDGFIIGGYPSINACGPKVLANGVYTQMLSHLVVDDWTPEKTASWAQDTVKQLCGL
jgi:multiple sugar transport system substrate-binding protein